MSAINDIAGIRREIEAVSKHNSSGYAAGWICHICTEVKIDQKHLWTEPVKELVLKILRPLTDVKNLQKVNEIIPPILKELTVLEISESTGLIRDLASIIFDYTE